MKILGVYDKNSHLTSYGKDVFRTTEKYLKRFPKEYAKCYHENLETVEILRSSKVENTNLTGLYYDKANVIMYLSTTALGHELFHMASNDFKNKQYAFESELEIESGLIEGMTEYSRMKAYELDRPMAYEFEVFVINMLENVPNIFRPYFIPNRKDIFNVFPSKRDAYGLLYSLDYYNRSIESLYETDSFDGFDIDYLRGCIKNIIDILISVELAQRVESVTPGYADKFMDLIGSDYLKPIISEVYPRYNVYANNQIKKRIRKLG